MPIFDYACPSCSHQFERLVPRPETTVDCPECGKVAAKQLSAFAAHLAAGETTVWVALLAIASTLSSGVLVGRAGRGTGAGGEERRWATTPAFKRGTPLYTCNISRFI